MSYAHDQLLNLNLAPSMLRAVDILEMQVVAADPGPYYDKLGARKGLMIDLTYDAWDEKLERIAKGQTFMDPDEFIGEAYTLLEKRLAKRAEIARDKWLKKQRDLALLDPTKSIMTAKGPVQIFA